jgi:hypothetical protein
LDIDVKVTGQGDRNVGVKLLIRNYFLDAVGVLHAGLKETAFDFGVQGIWMQIHHAKYKLDAVVDNRSQLQPTANINGMN